MDFQTAKKAIETDLAALDHIRRAYLDDVKFAILGEQWDDAELARRRRRKRPALVYNRLPSYIRHVVNTARQDERAARAYPIGDGAIRASAELIDQRLRAIQIASDAPSARDTALECAVAGGFGWYRIVVDDIKGEKMPRIEGVRDPLAVVWDSAAIRADRSDIRHLAYMSTVSREEFKAEHGRDPVEYDGASTTWAPSESSVTICEFWYLDESGSVFQMLMDGAGVIGEPEQFQASLIPFIFVPGEEYFVDGKTYFKGVVRDAKEPQRFLNFWKSEVAEQIQSKKTPPAIVDGKSITDAEGKVYPEWADAEGNYAYRRVNDPAFPPIFPAPAQVPTGAANEAAQSVDDIKAAVGIYDASMGARSNEQSGRAIMARKAQGDIATLHFGSALDRAVRIESLILVELVLALDSSKRWVQLAGEDGEITPQEVGGLVRLRDGSTAKADFVAGNYGVIVTSGPSFSTRREETASLLQAIGQSFPQFGVYGADILAQAINMPGGNELADRIRRGMEKQGIIEPKDPTPEDQKAAQVQQLVAAVGEMSKEIERLNDERAQLAQAVEASRVASQEKLQAALLEAETRKQLALIERETRLYLAEFDRQTEIELANIKGAQAQASDTRKSAHDAGMAVLNDSLNEPEPFPPAMVLELGPGESNDPGGIYRE